MNIPQNSDFFKDLEVLQIQEDDYGKEIQEQTISREQHVDDDFNEPEAGVDTPNELPEPQGLIKGVDGNVFPAVSSYSYKKQAKAYVNLLNVTNKAILPKLYKKRLLTKQERERLKIIESDEKNGISFLSEDDIRLQAKYTEIRGYIDLIGFTDDEKNELVEALEEVLKLNNAPKNPTFTLIVALITIEGARLLPLIQK